MGLILKFKQSQQTRWDVFYQLGIEVFNQSKLIGIPFGKSGYGFIANPFDEKILNLLFNQFQDKIDEHVIFLAESLEFLKPLAIFSDKIQEYMNKILPNELIFTGKPQSNVKLMGIYNHEIPTQIWQKMAQKSINLMVPTHPVIRGFFNKLKEQNLPPILIGFLAGKKIEDQCLEAEDLIDFYNDATLGVILGSGKVQKGNKIRLPSYINIISDNIIRLVQEGLVSRDDLQFNEDEDVDELQL